MTPTGETSRGRPTGRWPLADFAIALALVLACNFVVLESPDHRSSRTPRLMSHRLAQVRIRALGRSATVDLAILGDSRAAALDANALCERVPGPARRCLNAATTAGDWFTAYSLFLDLEPRLRPGGTLLLCLSDYWLEGGRASDLELLPRNASYAELGEPALALSSFVPLSLTRGGRMRWVHDRLRRLATRARDALEGAPTRSATDEKKAKWQRIERSNVDAWYAPIDDETRRRRLRTARRVLDRLLAWGGQVILVNLPNPAQREDYVDETYPGRRHRYRTQTRRLAEEFGVAFVDLAGQLDDRRSYRDFHHIRKSHLPELTRMLADRIAPLVGEPAAPTPPAGRPGADR